MTSEVNEWYRGRKVLVTGASGLMGKVLIEKLLYSVPDIGGIYALVRSKRGKTPETRLFSRIREEKPHVMKKLIPVAGDILYDNLGVEKNQLQQLYDEVSVVFHFAATLRLEAPLKEGLEMNTKGTLRVLDVARQMKSLVAFLHLSTAFCYPDYDRMPEKLELLAPSIYQKHPNSYTYSKRLAEALVRESYPALPAVIARPSIGMLHDTTTATRTPSGWLRRWYGRATPPFQRL
ncbi:putative fatty acyl-CoA reductase [Operophtera brumata]|uniref:Fatty acyl-CoA reductase n=1 Tax=Operophtera brumata TaxID=104452 RepID=A0A0L7LP18_OPEBR|nr:putative fatty acyl-CoA reductase [Operophtera brumata]